MKGPACQRCGGVITDHGLAAILHASYWKFCRPCRRVLRRGVSACYVNPW